MSESRTKSFTPKFQRLSLWAALYGLMFPTLIGMVVFDYYPKIDVVIMSFFRWEPPTVMEYIGFGNFLDAASDPLFCRWLRGVGKPPTTAMSKPPCWLCR